jgi:hypothetical protein
MLAEWLFKKKKTPDRFHPRDDKKFIIAEEVVAFTADVLREYGQDDAEGVIYWCGNIAGTMHYIDTAVAPRASVTAYGFITDHDANAEFVDYISDRDRIYLAQVHSHPSKWVGHSHVDDEQTAFRAEGILSVVVPHFAEFGLKPLKKCGIHLYRDGRFRRLSDTYISGHFKLRKMNNINLKDFRHE